MAVRQKRFGKPIISKGGYSIRPIYGSRTIEVRGRKESRDMPNGTFGIFGNKKQIGTSYSSFEKAKDELELMNI